MPLFGKLLAVLKRAQSFPQPFRRNALIAAVPVGQYELNVTAEASIHIRQPI
jgi:hypothetical protein